MTNPRHYIVFAAGKYACEAQSLIGASIAARDGATFNPGVLHEVRRDGRLEAHYTSVKGAMKAWVR